MAAFLARWVWVAWLLTVVGSLAWMPFRMGFWLDDWRAIVETARQGAPFSWQRYVAANAIDPHRIALGPVRWLFSSVLGEWAFGWHLCLLLASLLTVYLIARAAGAMFPGGGRASILYAAAATWLILPWSIAFRVWPLFLAVQVGMCAFAWALVLLLEGWSGGRTRFWPAALFYLFSCLCYEAFSLQFLIFAGLGLVLVWEGRASLRRVMQATVWLSGAQAVTVLWRVAAEFLQLSSRKQVDPHWFRMFLSNFENLPHAWMFGSAETRYPLIALIAAGTVLAGVSLRKAIREQRSGVLGAVAAIGLAAIGAVVSLLIFSAGVRYVEPTGVETRSLSMVSFWMAFAAAVLGEAFRRYVSRGRQWWMGAVSLAAGVCLLIGYSARLREWESAWVREQSILRNAPMAVLREAPAGATILYLNDLTINGAPLFCADWDLSRAMPLTYPETRDLQFVVYSHWLGPMAWGGRELVYTNGSAPSRAAAVVYIWDGKNQQIRRASNPFVVNELLETREQP